MIELNEVPVKAFFFIVTEPQFRVEDAVPTCKRVPVIAVVIGDSLQCGFG